MRIFLEERDSRFKLVLLLTTILWWMPALSSSTQVSSDQDRMVLLEKHQNILTAFLTANSDLLFESVGEGFFVATEGAIVKDKKNHGVQGMREHFKNRSYVVFEDVVTPTVKISQDGSLGWVLVNVVKQGTEKVDGGAIQPFSEISVWIELYQKRDEWVLLGTVSSSKEIAVEK